jgi:Secretion system C-terminal sorting domain
MGTDFNYQKKRKPILIILLLPIMVITGVFARESDGYPFGMWPKDSCRCKNNFGQTFADVNTGVQHDVAANVFSVFPNPAKNYFFARLPKNILNGKVQLTITDIFGRKVKTIQLQNNLERINITGLASATYFVELIKEKIKYTSILVIE